MRYTVEEIHASNFKLLRDGVTIYHFTYDGDAEFVAETLNLLDAELKEARAALIALNGLVEKLNTGLTRQLKSYGQGEGQKIDYVVEVLSNPEARQIISSARNAVGMPDHQIQFPNPEQEAEIRDYLRWKYAAARKEAGRE